MSIKQINKVFNDETLKGNEKLLMLALADNSNDTGISFPSWNSLITKTSMSKGSICKWLNILEEKQLIFRVSRNRQNGSKTSNKYLIYPHENKLILDEEDYLIFEDLYSQSSEVELPAKVQKLNYPSSEVELLNGEQSSEVELVYEPSLIFNHQENTSRKKNTNNEKLDLAKRTIDFLNLTVKKSFNYTDGNLKEIKSQINKLMKNGDDLKTIENKFAHVIRVKSKEWLNNQEMKKHLNPVTLFRESNFDKYLNQDMGFSTSDIVDKIYEARNAK